MSVGAQDLPIQLNVLLDTDDLETSETVAGGIEGDGVSAIAYPLPSRDCTQVAVTIADHRKTSPLRTWR